MTSFDTAARRTGLVGVALAAMQLAACASAPHGPVLPAEVAAPPPPPPVVTMAPIPNPTEPVHERHYEYRSRQTRHEREAEHAAEGAASSAEAPKSVLNPARAAQLRARGLEELDRGSVDRAVSLLTEASRLDPDNQTIQRDLKRAQRVAETVHGAR